MKFQRFVIGGLFVLVLVMASFILGEQKSQIAEAQAGGIQNWEYAVLVYSVKDGTVSEVQVDDTEQKKINDGFTTFQQSVKVDKKNIPSIYYLNIVGRFGWELASEYIDVTGQVYTLKRPYTG